MLVPTVTLLREAQRGGYAVGAFNVYNLEGALAVVAAADAECSPAMLQLLPAALARGGSPLIALCLEAARGAQVPIAVQLDHATASDVLQMCVDAGLSSIMADGSGLGYEENVAFTRRWADLAHARGLAIEAELGRISGNEDGLSVAEREARMTDPAQAADYCQRTGVDALAVCIGNVHGHYPGEPRLDFPRLEAIRARVDAPLVLHGASGLPEVLVRGCIARGVSKFNVNTEVRGAYMQAARERLTGKADLLDLMGSAMDAMQAVVAGKLRLFGSANRIDL